MMYQYSDLREYVCRSRKFPFFIVAVLLFLTPFSSVFQPTNLSHLALCLLNSETSILLLKFPPLFHDPKFFSRPKARMMTRVTRFLFHLLGTTFLQYLLFQCLKTVVLYKVQCPKYLRWGDKFYATNFFITRGLNFFNCFSDSVIVVITY